MKKHPLLLAFLMGILAFSANAQTRSILDFGAKTDTTFLNTRAIQAAIDACFAQGGGEVLVPAGTFYTGTIFLKSRVYLRLAPGAVLQGSYNPADYPEHDISDAKKFGTITHDGLSVKTMKALVIAHNAEYTGLVGTGTVKGPGEGKAFQLGINKDGKPKNLFFIGCRNVLLRDVTVLNSAQVTISISGCERVNVDGIYVRSLVNWNCDGMDVDARDVTIANCVIASEDDALCFKSEYMGRFCENITVTNCVVSSLCNGIKLGTGSRSGFRNVTVSNCVIKKASFNGYRHWQMTPDVVHQPEVQSVNTGIVILGVDGGLVENVQFSDIVMTDVISPIFIRVGRRFVNPDGKPSVLRNVTIRNVRADSRSILPSVVAGLADSPVEGVRLSNIRVTVPIGVKADFFKTFPTPTPEDVKGYPENRLTFGTKMPAGAFYFRHVNGLEVDDVSVTFRVGDARPAIFADDCRNVALKNVRVNGQRLESHPTLLKQVGSEGIVVTP